MVVLYGLIWAKLAVGETYLQILKITLIVLATLVVNMTLVKKVVNTRQLLWFIICKYKRLKQEYEAVMHDLPKGFVIYQIEAN